MDLKSSYTNFLKSNPSFEKVLFFDELRTKEYPLLDEQKHIYLDYTGGNLFSKGQIKKHNEILFKNVYGNPHSSNPTSRIMTDLVRSSRKRILKFFNADPNEYEAIFTKNTSEALKLVGESYPFNKDDQFLLTVDNHNSVLGLREYGHIRGAKTIYTPMNYPEMTINHDRLLENLHTTNSSENNLFAYPAQSNFSGIQHSLDLVKIAQDLGWDVILDAAAFVPTNKLDLNAVKPNYVAVSFYKMFGWPTGVGALIVKKDSLKKLQRPWFGGGTIVAVSVAANTHHIASGAAGFEDGTLDYLSLPAIEIGLDYIDELGIDNIHNRVSLLTGHLINNLKELKHDSGVSLVHFYGEEGPQNRGGTLSINLFKSNGEQFNSDEVQHLANNENISFRTGCFCNPGISEIAFEVKNKEIISCFADASSYNSADEYRSCVGPIGAIRISTGFITNYNDIFHFVQFVKSLLNKNKIS